MIPVIAIDGPSASGKGTVAQRVAEKLGFNYLDSGALYRIVALSAQLRGISEMDEKALSHLSKSLHIEFKESKVIVNNQDVTDLMRSEECGIFASKIAAVKSVRDALMTVQHQFKQKPGLVADGRDMASVVFPEAILKIFLTASSEIRAQRRYNQLINKGISANIKALLQDIVERDHRDLTRKESPLKQTLDAHFLDTSALTIDQAVNQVLQWFSGVSK
ncbi:(d)CMP kinase [Ferrovum sp. PN-J185]|uniref:(d)CMP kinase n=1 Tax=Ferrovum sp. PN-J185 TaxID=1356306 RepID=UPI001E39E6B8|nr:(d)CMP kinase [Ferrovum sp. PN-J185]MCC6069260.1 (d)CMP kinase [Ferrovum sp. PN-J185]